jgi:ML domain
LTASATSTLRAVVEDTNGVYSLPADQQNGCDNLYGATCPMNAGEHGQWDLTLPVGNDLAGSSLKFTLYGDGNAVVTCFNMAVNIV